MTVYATAVALGLGAVVSSHPAALTIIELVGAAYLGWLAITTVRSAHKPVDEPQISAHRWYVRGVIVSLSNPKLILFFLGFLPRFIGNASNTTAQLALLGAVNVAAEVVLYGTIGIGASFFRVRISPHAGAQRILHYAAATVYVALSLFIMLGALKHQ